VIKNYLFLLLFLCCKSNSSESDVFEVVQYGAGIYGSIYIHELGHAITAKYYGGYDIDIDVPRKDGGWLSGNTSYKLPKRTYESERVTAVSGLVATTLASEVIIQNSGLYKNPFAQSILATSHITNIRYVYKYYTNDTHTVGDLEKYARADGYIHAFNALLIGYTIWSLKRMSDKSIPIFSVGFKF
jgi:hypothetical protein